MSNDKEFTVQSYNENNQTLIGQTRRTLVDNDTGEKIEVDQITKRVYGQKNFWKVYLMDFLTMLGIIDSKQLDVFIFIAENTNPSDNRFIGTYRSISKDCGVAYSTTATIMKKLITNNFIKKVQNGVYQVSPNLMVKGNDHKRQMLLSYYDDDRPLNTTTIVKNNEISKKGIDTISQGEPSDEQ